MTVRVKYFAIARDLAGRAEQTLELADGATAGDALAAIVAETPKLANAAGRMALAVNLEYVGPTHVLRDGDEVALIPPVSGGSGPLSRVLMGEGWGEGERRVASLDERTLPYFDGRAFQPSPSP